MRGAAWMKLYMEEFQVRGRYYHVWKRVKNDQYDKNEQQSLAELKGDEKRKLTRLHEQTWKRILERMRRPYPHDENEIKQNDWHIYMEHWMVGIRESLENMGWSIEKIEGENRTTFIRNVWNGVREQESEGKEEMMRMIYHHWKTARYTHFLSLPLKGVHKEKMMTFQEELLHWNGGRSIAGIDESIFMKKNKFHITVAMLKLYSHEELGHFKQFIIPLLESKEIQEMLSPLRIQLKGIDIMDLNEKQANILYAKIVENEKGIQLKTLCEYILDQLIEYGWVSGNENGKNNFKMHATLINTKYREENNGKKYFKRQPFDASALLTEFRDYDFGENEIDEIHISHLMRVDSQGYYYPESIMTLKKY